VVYKIDRLTRSLLDFSRIVELFDRHGVSFVAVTQSFNTSNSMGRLMLNVLLSFAQYERELTSERIRDKIAASQKLGYWMGGYAPFGYDCIDKGLKINEAYVRRILKLNYLSPKIKEMILEGRLPKSLKLQDFLHDVPLLWKEQEECLV
jgi:DNA invertase Pin-like site-specific DNA recombinase